MDALQLFCFMCMNGSKVPLACAWHAECFYTAGPVLQNDVDGLANGKHWVSMPLTWNAFTMLTRETLTVSGFSTNVPLMLLTSWLLGLYARSMLCIITNHTCMAL